MVTLTDQDECEFLKKELQQLLTIVQGGGFKVGEETYFFLEHEQLNSKVPLPTENFVVFKNSRGNKPGDHVEMLSEE